jgi:serine/threonine protein kinase
MYILSLLEFLEENVLYCFSFQIFIVLEHAGHGDLLKLVYNSGGLTEDKAQELFRQVVAGVGYLHDNNIIHRYIF